MTVTGLPGKVTPTELTVTLDVMMCARRGEQRCELSPSLRSPQPFGLLALKPPGALHLQTALQRLGPEPPGIPRMGGALPEVPWGQGEKMSKKKKQPQNKNKTLWQSLRNSSVE